MSSPSAPGLSRRALFGAGLARLGERLEAAVPADAPRPRPGDRPSPEEVRGRWSHAAAAAERPAWPQVAADLAAHAPPGALSGAVLDDGAAVEGERVVAAGDLAALEHADATFDAALSAFGPQRTPDGRRAIAELFRVVRPGGHVGFAVWPLGVVPRLLREALAVEPALAGAHAPWAWGRRERLRQDLDHVADDVAFRRGEAALAFASVDGALDVLAAAAPVVGAALAARPEQARERLAAVLAPYAGSGAGGALTIAVPYLAVAARRR